MKIKLNLFLILIVLNIFICAGCTWSRADRPVPVTPPYSSSKSPGQIKTESEFINDVVSEISLQIAVSGRGPFHVISAGKISRRGAGIIHALEAMELLKPHGITLYFYETTGPKYTIYLTEADKTTIFYKKIYSPDWKGVNNDQKHND